MAIPGNSRKGNFSKAIIKRQFQAMQFQAITCNAIPGMGILGNPRQSYSRHGNCRQFQPTQFQGIPGKKISNNSWQKIRYKKIPDNSRQEILGKALPSNSSQGNSSKFITKQFQARNLHAIPENTISGFVILRMSKYKNFRKVNSRQF